ncbi:MAG: hypothetical protein K0Q68_2053 [Moraxellaceae bacterium]|jgi:hypothetical protein|nr:hypothetical protein [Moraxellaceae bacterium]
MRLADLHLAVRPRRAYEAMDLGIRLVQDEAGLIWRTWVAVTLPVLLLGLALSLHFGNGAGYLLLWWLKPLFDHALLLVISRRVFGDTLSGGALLGLLAGAFRQGLAGHLLWRRLSMSRAYLLPVWLLENLPLRERRARLTLLRHQHTGRARWLHFVMLHFELFLAVAILSLLFWFAPEGVAPDLLALFSGGEGSRFVDTSLLLAYYGAMSVVEPFYVGAGFSLYLNRRTELEAWDLELAFRHLRERLAGARPPS